MGFPIDPAQAVALMCGMTPQLTQQATAEAARLGVNELAFLCGVEYANARAAKKVEALTELTTALATERDDWKAASRESARVLTLYATKFVASAPESYDALVARVESLEKQIHAYNHSEAMEAKA